MRKISAEEWRELFALLDTALELPPAARESWLNGLASPTPELIDALRDLLARQHIAPFAGELPRFTENPGEPGEPVAEDTAAPGVSVGPYRLLAKLGRGGMGSVWVAERLDGMPKRRVALKLPHLGSTMSALAQRMARERDLLASLEHPGIARLYDAGVAADGRPYLALELVDGVAIDLHCREHAPDLATRVQLALQIARAVAYAHSRQIVHRDLKPSNILVDRAGQVRVLDFGIGKLLEDPAGAAAHDTQFGARAFTPDYVAPEQSGGGALTASSDVYSLGVVLYEMLGGELPAPPGATRRPPRPLARRSDLATVVLKALKESVFERYATMSAFADDLERYLRGEPVLAKPDTAWYRIRKLALRNRRATAAVGATIAVALAFSVAVVVHETRQREAATARALELSADAMATRSLPRTAPPQDATAYREYLKARSLMLRPTEANLREVLALAQSVNAREPEFAPAHALLGGAHVLFLDIGYPHPDALALGERSARRALELDARLPGAHATLGSVAAHRAEWLAAAAHFERAFALDDRTGRIHARHAQMLHLSTGSIDAAWRELQAEFRLTPGHARGAMQVAGTASLRAGNDAAAVRYADIAISLGWPGESPEVQQVHWNAARRAGRFGQALEHQAQWLPAAARDAAAIQALELLHAALADRSQRNAALRALDDWNQRRRATGGESFPMLMFAMQWYVLLDDLDRAHGAAEFWIAHSARTGLSGIPDNAGFWTTEMRPFRADPRFHALAVRMGLLDYWRAMGPPDGCRITTRISCVDDPPPAHSIAQSRQRAR